MESRGNENELTQAGDGLLNILLEILQGARNTSR